MSLTITYCISHAGSRHRWILTSANKLLVLRVPPGATGDWRLKVDTSALHHQNLRRLSIPGVVLDV